MTSTKKNTTRSIWSFLGLKRSIVGLLGMAILVGMGEKMGERFLPLYLLTLGGGIISVGFLNGLDNLLSALYSFPGGYISDRFGTKKALLIFNLVAMIGFLIVILIQSWIAVIVGTVFFLSWTAISLPATMSLVSEVLPKSKHVMGVSMHSFVRRIPMALGPIIGGALIVKWGMRDGIRLAFVIALILALVALVMQQVLIKNISPDKKLLNSRKNKINPFLLLYHSSSNLKKLLVADILIRFCEQIPYAFVVIWCTMTISHPISTLQFGVLTTIEMVTAMLIYLPVAYFSDKYGKRPFVLITFVFFTLFPITLLYSQSFPLLICAFILRGMKEFGEPSRKALIMELAAENRKAATFGAYYLTRDLIVSIAAFGGVFLWKISPATNFISASLCGTAGIIWLWTRWQGPSITENSHTITV